MDTTKPAMGSGGRIARLPALLDLVRTLWRRVRPRSHARRQQLATLSDHLLADMGLNRPVQEPPTWKRTIHRH